jgi:hypothetical protein
VLEREESKHPSLPDISTIDEVPSKTMLAHYATESPTNSREDLARTGAYLTKAKSTEGFKKQPSTCGNADALNQALVDFAVRTFGRIEVLIPLDDKRR